MQLKTQSLVPTDFDERFERGFGLVAAAANRHILDHMHRITIEMGMDLETAVVWGTLAHLNLLPSVPLDSDPMLLLDAQGLATAVTLTPVRLTDLTQVTGLPRETVRRKLERLRQFGKIERTSNGKWQFLHTGIDASDRAFTRETVIRMLRTAESIVKALDKVVIS